MADTRRVPPGRIARLARMASVGMRVRSARRNPEDGAAVAAELVRTLGTLRGLAAKVGQLASYVDGLAPAVGGQAVADALAALRAAAPSSPPAVVRRVVERELGQPLERLFAEWGAEPFASASVGQVHLARLDDGREVAVKVQHPGIERAIASDLANAAWLERGLAPLVGHHLHSRELLDEARARFLEELDYGLEAERQAHFARLHAADDRIVIPAVVPSRSSRRVLTTELARGLEFEAACGAPVDERRSWAETLWRFVFRGSLLGGLFNADPHPGNYLFQPEGRVAFLDFGCVQPFSPDRRLHALAVHHAALAGDEAAFERAGTAFLEPRPGRHAELALAFNRRCFEPIFSSPFRITREYVTSLLRELRASAREARKLPPEQVGRLPEGVLFMNRLQFGFYSVLARLDVEVDYAATERTLLTPGATYDGAGQSGVTVAQ